MRRAARGSEKKGLLILLILLLGLCWLAVGGSAWLSGASARTRTVNQLIKSPIKGGSRQLQAMLAVRFPEEFAGFAQNSMRQNRTNSLSGGLRSGLRGLLQCSIFGPFKRDGGFYNASKSL